MPLRVTCLTTFVLAISGSLWAQEAPKSPAGPLCDYTQPTGRCETCTAHQPTQVQVDWLFMRRLNPNAQPIFVNQAGATVLDARDFQFDYESGVQAKVIRPISECWGLEARYFGLFENESQASFAIPTGLNTIRTNPPSNFGGGAGGAAIFTYSTEIHSGELSGRRSLGERFTAVAGFRYINLYERLEGAYRFINLAGTESQRWKTNNNLWGLQTGLDAKLWSTCRFELDGFVRAGIYVNNIDSTFNTDFVGGGSNRGVDSGARTAFAGEIGLSGTYKVTQNISVRGGYQLLWLSGVALASEQVATTGRLNPPFIPNQTINLGDTVYHGLNVGVELRW